MSKGIPEEIAPLLEMCRLGKLYEVEEWIKQGKPIESPSELRTSALRIAIDKGFHSLVKLLVKSGARLVTGRFDALHQALWNRQFEIAELLITYGADQKSLTFDRFYYHEEDPKLLKLFFRRWIQIALCN